MSDQIIYTKESLNQRLKEIREMGWIPQTGRFGNVGSIGGKLEDLLGIEENNLPIPNAAEWELKTHKIGSASLITLFHMEPSPRTMRFVPRILLPNYGWRHESAGCAYPETEMSFRQTINGKNRSDRGFKVVVDRVNRKVLISFDYLSVDNRHSAWLKCVEQKIGLDELNPQPYFGFDDLFHKAGTKLLNCFFVEVEVKKENDLDYYHYHRISMMSGFILEKFLDSIEDGNILVDFDSRSGHNHGTKFRFRQSALPSVYSNVIKI